MASGRASADKTSERRDATCIMHSLSASFGTDAVRHALQSVSSHGFVRRGVAPEVGRVEKVTKLLRELLGPMYPFTLEG